jgi:hypothetical protein
MIKSDEKEICVSHESFQELITRIVPKGMLKNLKSKDS